eukprot:765761-Hanusia_phi.AAC.3
MQTRKSCTDSLDGWRITIPQSLTRLSLRGGSRKGKLKATDEDRANVEGVELTADQEKNLRRHWKKKPEFLVVKKGGVEKQVKTSSILKVMKDNFMLEQRQREKTPLQLIDLGQKGLKWVRKIGGMDMQEKYGVLPIRLPSNLTDVQSKKLQIVENVLQAENGYQIAKETRPLLFNQLSLTLKEVARQEHDHQHILVAGAKPEDAIQHLGSHTYGEISPSSFAEILHLVQPKQGETFVDLGSGTGKAVIVAASLFPFSEAIGIEFVEPLHKAATRLHENLCKQVTQNKSTFATPQIGKIRFYLDDAMEFDWWTKGDVVFAANTCWTDEMNDSLKKRMAKLRVGARVITMTRSLDLDRDSWLLRHKIVRKYGPGMMTFFLFEKVANLQKSVKPQTSRQIHLRMKLIGKRRQHKLLARITFGVLDERCLDELYRLTSAKQHCALHVSGGMGSGLPCLPAGE